MSSQFEREMYRLLMDMLIQHAQNRRKQQKPQPPKIYKQAEMPKKYRDMPSIEYIEVDEQGNYIKRPGAPSSIIPIYGSMPPEYDDSKIGWSTEPKSVSDFAKEYTCNFDIADGESTQTYATGRMKNSFGYTHPPIFDDMPRSRCAWEPIEWIITPPESAKDLEAYRKHVQEMLAKGCTIPKDKFKEVKRKL